MKHLEWFGDALARQGFRVVLFDHTGHGASPHGTRSLEARLVEARAVLTGHLSVSERVTVVGFSMGGFTAIELCAEFRERVANVVLIAPAAYGDHTRNAEFGPDFRELISATGSWATASCFRKLETLNRPVTLAIPATDAVIPQGITDRYISIVRGSPRGIVRVFDGAPHALDGWLRENRSATAELTKGIWRQTTD